MLRNIGAALIRERAAESRAALIKKMLINSRCTILFIETQFPSSYRVLLNNFLKANESNKSVAKVSGKRKREVVLVFWLFQQNTKL